MCGIGGSAEGRLLHGEERFLSKELCALLISVCILSLYRGAALCRPNLHGD